MCNADAERVLSGALRKTILNAIAKGGGGRLLFYF